MTKVSYLIGAGASADALPTVSDIPSRLLAFKQAFSLPHYYTDDSDLNPFKDELVTELTKLHKVLVYFKPGKGKEKPIEKKLHGSIDTYAKKLFIIEHDLHEINKRRGVFNKLKILMSLFFSFEQMVNYIDIRYDTFFASILKKSFKDLPDTIRIISWNYDSQFEMAYRSFSKFRTMESSTDLLGVVTKFTHFNRSLPNSKFSIFKINGTCTFNYADKEIHLINRENAPVCNHLLKHYRDWKEKPDSMLSTISFAWEDELSSGYPRASSVITKAIESIEGTKILVIIGYSFPLFNREQDKAIIDSIKTSIDKIYIQDLHPEIIKDRLLSMLHIDDEKIKLVRDYDQFILPPELSI